jgi:flagellar biosynthesis/type III secretory pathway protein FliH
MTLPRGRVIRGRAPDGTSRMPGAGTDRTRAAGSALLQADGRDRARVLKGAVADASIEAARRLQMAEQQAQQILEAARAEAEQVRAQTYREAKSAAETDLAAAWLRLHGEEARTDERTLERTIDLARAMAERLLGDALAADPERIVTIARQALTSARQARRVIIRAHPLDGEVLAAHLGAIGLEGATVQIHADEARGRGSLYFETDLGSLDAQLTLQLDRLARSLREPRRA